MILLPKNIKNLTIEKNRYKDKNASEEISVYGDGSRPIVNRLIKNLNIYWDIPTTLSTLSKLIDLVNPSSEIGIDLAKQDWINHEVRNFKGTIEILVASNPTCKSHVYVKYI